MKQYIIRPEKSELLTEVLQAMNLDTGTFVDIVLQTYADSTIDNELYTQIVLTAVNDKIMNYDEINMGMFVDSLEMNDPLTDIQKQIKVEYARFKHAKYIKINDELEAKLGEERDDLKREEIKEEIKENKKEFAQILKEEVFDPSYLSSDLLTYPKSLEAAIMRYTNAVLRLDRTAEELDSMEDSIRFENYEYHVEALQRQFDEYKFVINNPHLTLKEHEEAFQRHQQSKMASEEIKSKTSERTNISKTEGFKPMGLPKDYKPMD